MDFFEAEQWIPVELQKVFAFFSDPTNLPMIMPSELDARVLSIDRVEPPDSCPLPSAAGPGTNITFTFRPVPFLPLRQRWIARIVEFQYLSYFRDVQIEGPMKSWDHRHEFQSETRGGVSGTIIRDKVRFEVGYGLLGRVAERLFLTRQMQRTFAHRQAMLERALNSPVQISS